MVLNHTDVLYNAALLVMDVAYLSGVRRDRGRAMVWGGIAIGVVAMAVGAKLAAWGDGGGFFATMRMLAWGLFVHGPLVLAGAAVLARSTLRIDAIVCAVLAVAVALVGIEAFLVGPYRFEVRFVRLESPKLTKPVRIAVVTDIQTDQVGDWERRCLTEAMACRADLILLPGDYIQVDDAERRAVEVRALNALVREVGLDAPLGVYAVRGNIEGYPEWTRIFDGTRVERADYTRVYDAGELRIVAIDLFDSFNTLLSIGRSARFQIAFGHAPDFALGGIEADLLVAGHTHGGQVRLPFLGPLVTFSSVPSAWASGTTDLGDGRTLVVSRGLGMERGAAPRLRFNCNPELVVIDVVPAAK